MRLPLLTASTILLLSGCLSTYDYEQCGVMYDKPVANPLGTNGALFANTWGDVMSAAKGNSQGRFFRNNACMLTGETEQEPD